MMIVVISVRQSTVAAISASLPGAGYGQRYYWQPDCKICEAGVNGVREIDGERYHRDYSGSGYPPSSACHALKTITVITPLPTKPSATKMPENWSWRTRHYWHADASAWCCCCARCKIHEELADAKAENDALRDDAAAGRRRLHDNSPTGQCVKPPLPPAWIMQPPLTGRHRWTDYFTLRERLITMQENNWKEPRSILTSSVDRVAHIDGQLYTVMSNNSGFQRSINA